MTTKLMETVMGMPPKPVLNHELNPELCDASASMSRSDSNISISAKPIRVISQNNITTNNRAEKDNGGESKR
ncbi:hypothetical protein KAN5_19530 [Pseudoalteromonas sp. KAN5]|nr:hypothetical protein KAN5_19530 [Pseudoalteromonas sp. KAN5]